MAELRVHGVSTEEPPLLARELAGEDWLEAALRATAEYRHPDCAYVLEAAWDLWLFDDEWKLAAAPVTLIAYGPMSPSAEGEQLLIDFGPDAPFLPAPEHGGHIAPVRHNIRGLLHLVNDLDGALAVEKRRLWSESGENFAQRLQFALEER